MRFLKSTAWKAKPENLWRAKPEYRKRRSWGSKRKGQTPDSSSWGPRVPRGVSTMSETRHCVTNMPISLRELTQRSQRSHRAQRPLCSLRALGTLCQRRRPPQPFSLRNSDGWQNGLHYRSAGFAQYSRHDVVCVLHFLWLGVALRDVAVAESSLPTIGVSARFLPSHAGNR